MDRRTPSGTLMELECRQAQRLLEERFVGAEPLDTVRESALDAHIEACEVCADFTTIMEHLGSLPPPMPTEMERLRSVRAARTAYFEGRNRRHRFARWSAVAAAAVLLAMLYPIYIYTDSNEAARGPALTPGARYTVMDGRVTLFSSAQSQFQIVQPDRDTMHVRLDDGFVCADILPNPNRHVSFRVVTPSGNVDVKGTVFAVRVSDNDGIHVEVVRGEVVVSPKGSGRTYAVERGHAFNLQTLRLSELENTAENQIHSMLGIPLTVPPSDYPLSTEPLEDSASMKSMDIIDAGAQTLPTVNPRRRSLKMLLDEAEECRLHQDWECAASAYNRILAHYPNHREAATAMVTIAQIQLRHLRNPSAALQHFKRYQQLYPTGVLSEQALHGIALADRSLGDRAAEARDLELFLRRHPSSPLAVSARMRLRELKEKR